jgi:hypothetical protein
MIGLMSGISEKNGFGGKLIYTSDFAIKTKICSVYVGLLSYFGHIIWSMRKR